MKLRWDVRALQDLRDIHSYISIRGSAAAAERVRRHLQARINLLIARPRMGAATTDPALRILQPTRYPYRIYRDPAHPPYRAPCTGRPGRVAVKGERT